MLRVKTVLKLSDKHGIGLFADQFIPKGTITWQYDSEYDTSFSEEQIEKLEDLHKPYFLKYGYYDSGKYILCSDDQRFINHSTSEYNVQSTPDNDTAIRDIQPGEELLCNYNHYEPDWFSKRNLKEEDFT